jgi:hypothetical protein
VNKLAIRLIGMLNVTHRRCGVDAEPLVGMLGGGLHGVELHELSPAGVLAFVGDYVLAAWPDDEIRVASPTAYRVLSARLKARGYTRHMVHPLNFRSVKLTRKMGAIPIGVDADGFVHYVLLTERFPHHGQENAAAEAT